MAKECKYCKVSHDSFDDGLTAADAKPLMELSTCIRKGKKIIPLCNYSAWIFKGSDTDAVIMFSAVLQGDDGGAIDESVKIKYCPMCGRKL